MAKTPNILGVDDEPPLVNFLRTVLEDKSYEVKAAANGGGGRGAHPKGNSGYRMCKRLPLMDKLFHRQPTIFDEPYL